MNPWLDWLNNEYFHAAAIIAIVAAFFYAEWRFRTVVDRLDQLLGKKQKRRV